MNIYVYVALVTLAGLVAAYFFGRVANSANGVGATFLFLIVSVALGMFLSFPLTMAVAWLCHSLGIAQNACVNTDDRTVWYLAVPLILFPAYTVCMFVGRATAKQKTSSVEQPIA
jgi:bacteriorhodopsin